jgi:hypothetical protein
MTKVPKIQHVDLKEEDQKYKSTRPRVDIKEQVLKIRFVNFGSFSSSVF